MAYQIRRFYADPSKPTEIIETFDELEEAKAHCNDPESSSRTATDPDAVARTRQFGAWFDGYQEI